MAHLSKTAAALRISGDDLDPDEVTQLLGRKPDRAQRKGEFVQAASGEHTSRTGVWSVKAGSRTPGDLDLQIGELLAGTTDDLAVWRRLADRFRVDVFCGFFMRDANEGISVSPLTLKRLGERGIELGLDIYAPSQKIDD
jgi:ribosomal protein L19